jgi:hypothetical protein
MKGDELFPLASGREPEPGVHIQQRDATLWVAELSAGTRVAVPDAPFVHVFIARGSADLDGAGQLGAGDAARLTQAGGRDLVAGGDGAHAVIWEMWSDLVLA